MKPLLKTSLGTLLLLSIVCTHAQEGIKATQAKMKDTSIMYAGNREPAGLNMQGAYAMLMQIMNNGNGDSMINMQQFKIYTDRHFMYAHALPGDSLAYYGIGTYRMENGKLTEYPFYTSANAARLDTIEISITKLGNGYVQVINFPPDSQG